RGRLTHRVGPAAPRNPAGGFVEPPAQGRRGSQALGRSGQPLLVAGSLDDLVAIAEADAGLERALLVPERRKALLELAQLFGKRGVVSLGKQMPELGPTPGGAVDLGVYLVERGHAHQNDLTPDDIPQSPAGRSG